MTMQNIFLKKAAPDVTTPRYQTAFSSVMDLHAYIDAPLTVAPGAIVLVPTGLFIAVPAGFEAQVRPRSGLALKHGITVTNSPGTIDADYRGEIKVIMANIGREPYTIQRGERIAQLVISPVVHARWEESDSLSETARGDGGFGHSGKH